MEVLSRLLDKAAADQRFKYHPNCAELGLTHLCFADDLLVFLDGSRESIEGLLAVLNRFACMSGLRVSLEKSTNFFAGLDERQKQILSSNFSFKSGTLPVRYLVMPLLTKRMSVDDYKPLIEKIRSKFTSWNVRFLSYAGRAQLISSIIYGLVNFWQSACHLPSGCLTEIESLCSSFLWSGPELSTTKARVAWKDLCLPRDEGGLGLRPLKDVSVLNGLKLIWRLISRAKLWVDWISLYIFQEETFWTIQEGQLRSWMVKKLLKYRELAKGFHKVEPRSGRQTQFWFDAWMDWGRLIDIAGSRGVTELGIPLNATLHSVMNGRRRRRHRLQVYNDIEDSLDQYAIARQRCGDEDDLHLWRSGPDTYQPLFHTKKTWLCLRFPKPKVQWSSLVWFGQATPKYSFIQWLAELNRLPTASSIRYWNPRICSKCMLCKIEEETRDHLFLACSYSDSVWRGISGRLLGDKYTSEWEMIHIVLRDSTFGHLMKFILRYGFQATLYMIWMERNRRRYGHQEQDEATLVVILRRLTIKNRLSSLQELGLVNYRLALQTWFLFSRRVD